MTRPPTLTLSAQARALAIAGVHPKDAPDHLREAVAVARGDLAEKRVRGMLNAPPHPRPWWLDYARGCLEEEDRRGEGVIVYCRDGFRLALQVKSSRGAADRWKWERRRRGQSVLGLVVAPPELSLDILWGRILGALILVREEAERLSEAGR